MRKASSLVIIVLLLASMAMIIPIVPVASDPAVTAVTKLKILLPNGEQNMTVQPEWIGDNYNITIAVDDVTNLYSFGISIRWNSTICNYTGQDRSGGFVTLGPNDRIWPGNAFTGLAVQWVTEGINNTDGYLNIGCSGIFDAGLAPDGNLTLCIIEFHVKDEGHNWIKFIDKDLETGTILYDNTASEIDFDLVFAPEPYESFNADIFIVPEFPFHLLMLLLLIATIMAVVLGKTTWSKRRKGRAGAI